MYGRPPPLGPPRLNLDKDAILRDMEKRVFIVVLGALQGSGPAELSVLCVLLCYCNRGPYQMFIFIFLKQNNSILNKKEKFLCFLDLQFSINYVIRITYSFYLISGVYILSTDKKS